MILHEERTRTLQSRVPVQETIFPLTAINASDLKQRPTAATSQQWTKKAKYLLDEDYDNP